MGASLADRFGWPEALVFRVWRRDVPLAWSAGGALLGAAAAWAVDRFRSARRPRPRPGALPPRGPAPPHEGRAWTTSPHC